LPSPSCTRGFSLALLGLIVLQIIGDVMEFLLNGDNLVHVMINGDKIVRPGEAEMVAAGGIRR
jgi:hypothetical protein